MGYIIDADMQNYFGSINHQCLREFLDHRIKDGVIRKMIDKWLKAGVLDNGQLVYPTETYMRNNYSAFETIILVQVGGTPINQ